jgi:hypothetical protein
MTNDARSMSMATDRARQPQVRDDRAGLLRVVHEVALREVVRLLADDLDRVLVGTDRAVRAQAEEHATDHVLARAVDVEVAIHRQREMRHVVGDAHGEVHLRPRLAELVEDRLHHRWRELLRRQPVAAAHDGRHVRRFREARRPPLARGRHDIEIERVAKRARLLRTVEHGDRAYRRRQRRREVFERKRPVQADLHQADLLALGQQPVHRLVRGFCARTHHDDDALGLGVPDIVKQPVLPARERRELVHRLLHDARAGEIERVARLARLEERVGVLRRSAEHRVIRGQRAAAVRRDQLVGQHRAQIVVAELLHLGDLVRGAEAVEEVQERNARAQGRRLRDAGEIVRLLH